MRYVFIVALFAVPLTAQAQSTMKFETGTMTVGGTIDLQNHSKDYPSGTNDQTVKTVNVTPQVGFFLRPYLAVIGTLGYRGESGDIVERDLYFVSGGVRFYQPLAFIHLYAGAEAGFHVTSYEADDENTVDVGINFPLGVLIPLSRHVALDVGVRLTKIWRDNDHPTGENYNSFIVEFGYLGVQAYF